MGVHPAGFEPAQVRDPVSVGTDEEEIGSVWLRYPSASTGQRPQFHSFTIPSPEEQDAINLPDP